MRQNFSLEAVLYAPPAYRPAEVDDSDLSPQERKIVSEHFAERVRCEEAFFGHDAGWIEDSSECRVVRIEPGMMNTNETASVLESLGIHTVLVFGTDLIKPPLLDPQRWVMINMHLGLSPYYRGTATNFYPLLNGEPEYIGATIHILDAGIDSGPILQHARPVVTQEDRPHTLGCKAISAGIEAMCAVVRKRSAQGPDEGVPQWKDPSARVYLRRDYHPRQVVELYQKLDEGWLCRALGSQRPAPRLVGNPAFF